VVNAKNKILTAIAATLMDGPAALRRYMMTRSLWKDSHSAFPACRARWVDREPRRIPD